jgi:GTPase KRas protein
MSNIYKMSNICRIVVIGGGSVGKTALTIQFVRSYFIKAYDPTIEDSYRKQCTVDGRESLLDILDTAGQDDYSALREQYMFNGDGFICVYSITSRPSFEHLRHFIEQIYRVKDVEIMDERVSGDRVSLIIVGNKSDLAYQREVSLEEGVNLAKHYQTVYMETSAKTRQNVDNIYFEIVRMINKNRTWCISELKPRRTHKCTLI